MTQSVKSIIGAQMDLIFAYIVEQTLTKIQIDIIIGHPGFEQSR